MTSNNLGNLAKIGQMKREPPAQSEMDGLLKSGRRRLKDAGNAGLGMAGLRRPAI